MQDSKVLEGQSRHKAQLIRYINKKIGTEFHALSSLVTLTPLSFYKHAALVCVIDQSQSEPDVARFLLADNGAFLLDGTNQPFYEANKLFGLNLTSENIADYVDFFFTQVAGRHGRFLPVNDIQDLAFENPKTIKVPTAVAKAFNAIDQSKVKKTKNGFQLQKVFLFQNALFSAIVSVDSKSGNVDMMNEDLLIDDFGALEDSWYFGALSFEGEPEELDTDIEETKN